MNRYQAVPKDQKYTLKDFQLEFPNEDSCLEYVKDKRWPGGKIACVRCGQERKHYRVKGRMSYCCPVCGNHVFPLSGTIFHKSTTSLLTWFYVIRLMSSTRVGISAKHVQRETGVTYKTAWRMMKQIRKLMGENITLSGPIEVDEAEFGGSDENKPKHLRGKRKITALGIVERQGRVVAKTVPNITAMTLCGLIAETVESESTLFTDLMHSYNFLDLQYDHLTVNHSLGYVNGRAHTNTIDGFWSLVKRGISGVYYQVGAEYLQSYLNEYAFRYNRRKVMRPMFSLLAERTTMQVCPSAREQRLLARPE
jgi:transposase